MVMKKPRLYSNKKNKSLNYFPLKMLPNFQVIHQKGKKKTIESYISLKKNKILSTKPEVVRCKKISSNGNESAKPKHVPGNWLTQLEKTEVILRSTDSNRIRDLIPLNMAGECSSQPSINIQDIVRAVVDNFNSLPSRSSINNPTSSASTIVDELNRCFQIPRGAQPHVESSTTCRKPTKLVA